MNAQLGQKIQHEIDCREQTVTKRLEESDDDDEFHSIAPDALTKNGSLPA